MSAPSAQDHQDHRPMSAESHPGSTQVSSELINVSDQVEMSSSRVRSEHWLSRLRSPWTLSVIAWLYLTLTQPWGLMWFDSGELALAAHSWGLGHPPGQPFYQILGALTNLLPHPLWALNHISVISIALCIPALAKMWHTLSHHQDRPSSSPLRLSAVEWLLGLGWFLLYPVWDQGARIEVYGLGLVLGLWSLALFTHPHHTARRLFVSGGLLGLCGATQPIFAVGFGLATIPHFINTLRRRNLVSCGAFVAGVCAGFTAPHLYIWWAIERSTGFVWGNWDSWDSAIAYFSGHDYRLNHYRWASVQDNLISWVNWASLRGHLLWCLLSIVGLILARSRVLVWWLIPTTIFGAIFPLAYQSYHPEVPDFSGYQLPTLALSLLGMWALARRLAAFKSVQGLAGLLCLIMMTSLSVSDPSPWSRGRRQHHLPLTIAHHWLRDLPPRALLFVESDHWVFPLMYAQQIDHVRPDVVIFNTGFARSSWYWRWQKRLHPEFPSIEDVDPQRTHRPRIITLAQAYQDVYTESVELAELLSRPSSPTPLLSRACASGWGMNARCSRPRSPPLADDLRRWAQLSAHKDPITARVLARLGVDLTRHLWNERRPQLAVDLGYAALSDQVSAQDSLRWWPAPAELWTHARQGLIGDPALLRATLQGLAGSSKH